MKYNADLYIIAAGKGSRMGGKVPKALVPITDEPNLTTTLKQIGKKFQNVFVVTNENIQAQWAKYFLGLDDLEIPNLVNLPIESGLGDGHAVLEALNHPNREFGENLCNDVVIVWGDVFFQHAEIIDELMSKPLPIAYGTVKTGLVPVVREDNPYVTLLTTTNMTLQSADFSKYGECHPNGFHDQSVFRYDLDTLNKSLNSLHDAYWKNGRYITQGGELSLLYTFHQLFNNDKGLKVYETEYPTLSFNTVEEVQQIQLEINEKWKSQS